MVGLPIRIATDVRRPEPAPVMKLKMEAEISPTRAASRFLEDWLAPGRGCSQPLSGQDACTFDRGFLLRRLGWIEVFYRKSAAVCFLAHGIQNVAERFVRPCNRQFFSLLDLHAGRLVSSLAKNVGERRFPFCLCGIWITISHKWVDCEFSTSRLMRNVIAKSDTPGPVCW